MSKIEKESERERKKHENKTGRGMIMSHFNTVDDATCFSEEEKNTQQNRKRLQHLFWRFSRVDICMQIVNRSGLVGIYCISVFGCWYIFLSLKQSIVCFVCEN